MGSSRFPSVAAASLIVVSGLIMSLAPGPSNAACNAPVCFAPGPQATVFTDELTVNGAGVYQPVSVEKIAGNDYDVAVALPLLPVYLTYPDGANAAPVNFKDILDTPYGAYVGTGAGKWSYAAAAKPLPNGALTVTAYQVTAGPSNVGISANLDTATIGFAVKVNNVAGMPAGAYHWVQVLADNDNITYNPGYGNNEDVLDNGGSATPYYDSVGVANAAGFFDGPSRPNAADPTQSDWWLADLFLATGPGATGSKDAAPGEVTLYDTGIQYGWANFHIDLGPLQNLKAAFAVDTSSIDNFDLAFGCAATNSCAGLNADLTQGYLNQLNQDFQAIPEPSVWALLLAGVALIGGAMRRRPARNAVRRTA